jgi:hypothetical protein
MRDAFQAVNPAIRFVDGLAPITHLLVAQFERALDRRPTKTAASAAARASDNRIEFRASPRRGGA